MGRKTRQEALDSMMDIPGEPLKPMIEDNLTGSRQKDEEKILKEAMRAYGIRNRDHILHHKYFPEQNLIKFITVGGASASYTWGQAVDPIPQARIDGISTKKRKGLSSGSLPQ